MNDRIHDCYREVTMNFLRLIRGNLREAQRVHAPPTADFRARQLWLFGHSVGALTMAIVGVVFAYIALFVLGCPGCTPELTVFNLSTPPLAAISSVCAVLNIVSLFVRPGRAGVFLLCAEAAIFAVVLAVSTPGT